MKAKDGSKMLGTGTARKAAKAIKKGKSIREMRLSGIMSQIRQTRGKK